jgi:hypothetical protein
VEFLELGVGLGVGGQLGSALRGEVRIEGVVRRLQAEATRAGEVDSASSTSVGGAVEGRLGVRLDALVPLVGLRVSRIPVETEIRVGNQRVGVVSPWAVTVEVGVAWSAF